MGYRGSRAIGLGGALLAASLLAACVPEDPGAGSATTTSTAAPTTTVPAGPSIEVDNAQLTWAYSGYAQYGVFGAWCQEASGPNVATSKIDGQLATGSAAEAGVGYERVHFDGGTGTLDEATGAGTITWETGEWVLNAYCGDFGAPDETLSNPVLDIEADGSGTLSFIAYIPAGLDMVGDPVAAVGPERVTVATFSSLTDFSTASFSITPDFAGRDYIPAGTTDPLNAACGGTGGSWPTEWIDFLPESVRPHYYTTGCAGLNLRKPALPLQIELGDTPLEITKQPVVPPLSSVGGPSFTATVHASGNTAPSYQWQRSADGETWTDIDGATGFSHLFTPVISDHNTQVRVVVSSSDGDSVVSEPQSIIFTDVAAPTLANPTTPELLAFSGGNTIYYEYYRGYPRPSAEVQISSDGGATWTVTPSVITAQGEPGLDIIVAEWGNTSQDQDGLLFRTVLNNGVGEPVISGITTLNVHPGEAPTVLTNPADVTVAVGEQATFDFASTAAYRARWQRSDDNGASWYNVTGWLLGEADRDFTITATAADDGALFRVLLRNLGSTESASARLTVTTP